MSAAWRQMSMDDEHWQTIFYTGYTTIRTAIITPIIMLFLFVVGTPAADTQCTIVIIVWCSLIMDLAYTHKLVPATWLHSKPVLLYLDGQMVWQGLHRSLLIPDQVRSAVRSKGHASMSKVYAVVLEPNGLWSVITHGELPGGAQRWLHTARGCCRDCTINKHPGSAPATAEAARKA
ncbi:hypothetical protein COO60DRAFT_1562013 [Scenedesmus sp. NREL 46B-D3]|nr:hypothetical protein COO60DRAFT_1562013 [Scenedesmus sp. NREL 46B-D3]